MKARFLQVLPLLGLALFSLPAASHHSISATYLQDTELELEGTLVQFVFRNPHSFVHIMVEDENGSRQRWAVEWTGISALAGRGMDAATLKPGDHLVLKVHPSRAGEQRGLMTYLNRPADELTWGNLPDEVVD